MLKLKILKPLKQPSNLSIDLQNHPVHPKSVGSVRIFFFLVFIYLTFFFNICSTLIRSLILTLSSCCPIQFIKQFATLNVDFFFLGFHESNISAMCKKNVMFDYNVWNIEVNGQVMFAHVDGLPHPCINDFKRVMWRRLHCNVIKSRKLLLSSQLHSLSFIFLLPQIYRSVS